MTAFAKENIPATVDTLEKLIVWSAVAFYKINKSATAIEGAGPVARIAQFGIFNVESANTTRVILRQSLPLQEDFAIDSKPIWENVVELSSDSLPLEFLAAS